VRAAAVKLGPIAKKISAEARVEVLKAKAIRSKPADGCGSSGPDGPSRVSRELTGRSMPAKGWDYVVVGAGAAGCVVAGRLSEMLPAARIALIEAGRERLGLTTKAWHRLHRQHLCPAKLELPDGAGAGG
jgi:hypothetical protein